MYRLYRTAPRQGYQQLPCYHAKHQHTPVQSGPPTEKITIFRNDPSIKYSRWIKTNIPEILQRKIPPYIAQNYTLYS